MLKLSNKDTFLLKKRLYVLFRCLYCLPNRNLIKKTEPLVDFDPLSFDLFSIFILYKKQLKYQHEKLLKLLAQLVSVFNDFVKERILYKSIPANIYLFKVSNRHNIKKSEICSKLTTKTPERRH